MKTYISILRGINVGGHRKIKMADLRELYSTMGFTAVQTYIQSGNVIFQCKQTDIYLLQSQIEEAIFKKFTFEVPVIIREKHEWKFIVQNNPFLTETETTDHLFVTFLSKEPKAVLQDQLSARQTENDQIKLIGKQAYLFVKGPYHKTPLNNQWIEKTLNIKATSRNWKTIHKVWQMLQESDEELIN